MQIKMKMPDLATSASVVTILKWLVEVGQPIKRGQPLLEIETDKAAMEVESFANGTLSAVHFQANDEVEVGAVIATIEVPDPATAEPSQAQPTTATASTSEPTSESEPAQERKVPSRPTGGMFARNRAAAEKRDEASNPEREEHE